MIRAPRSGCLLIAIACLAGAACLKRPDTIPTRMLEPQLLEPQLPASPGQAAGSSGAAAPLRLLDTQGRGHIGRRLLHQQPDGELTEDHVWLWTSAPDRYLDTALRLELASSTRARLVDAASAPTLAATLLVWQLESAADTRLVGAVEFRFTGTDRVVRARVIHGSEPVSTPLPGNLAAAAGRLLRRLASDGLKTVAP